MLAKIVKIQEGAPVKAIRKCIVPIIAGPEQIRVELKKNLGG